jgi:uncharacterized protein (DUF2147 family)
MIKYILIVVLYCCNSLQALAQDSFIGTWESEEAKLCIEIYTVEERYYAKVKNSDNKKMIGKEVLIQMVKKSDTKLYGGTYYDNKLEEEYEAKLKLVDKDTLRLKIFRGLFSKVIIWRRAVLTL